MIFFRFFFINSEEIEFMQRKCPLGHEVEPCNEQGWQEIFEDIVTAFLFRGTKPRRGCVAPNNAI